ncbi:MAG TPA: hypothetical protein PLZ51_12995 [Aggregatilineales bacterium]|nr:hypothetical protein [Aggregatilineales bacterium]
MSIKQYRHMDCPIGELILDDEPLSDRRFLRLSASQHKPLMRI